jgi:hypothetical protein
MHSNLSTDELASQVQALIHDAPSDGQTKQIVEIVANTLALLAKKHLNASHYYIVQDASGAWLKSTLSHRTQSIVEKTAIFVFSTIEDASKDGSLRQNDRLSPQKIPVIDLLFRFWTLNLSDSLIFDFHDQTGSVEISRAQISEALKKASSLSSGKGFGKKTNQGLEDIC